MARAEGVAPAISLVIPVHNEAESLPILWEELKLVLAGLGVSVEVIFVDDGSSDGSDKVIRRISDEDGRARGVHLAGRRGVSTAYHAGFEVARGETIVTLDADLQIDPRDIPAMLAAVTTADAAVGWRQQRLDSPAKRVASRLANSIRRRVIGDRFHDGACSLRAMSRACVAALPPYDGMHRFVAPLLTSAGFRVVEVPVAHRARRFGRSKFGILDRARRTALDLLAVRWMLARRLPRPPADRG
jgi:glycosyltransferase involved in cell wall biosynthesis